MKESVNAYGSIISESGQSIKKSNSLKAYWLTFLIDMLLKNKFSCPVNATKKNVE